MVKRSNWAICNKRVQETEDMQEQRTGQRSYRTQIYQIPDVETRWWLRKYFAEANKLSIDFTSRNSHRSC